MGEVDAGPLEAEWEREDEVALGENGKSVSTKITSRDIYVWLVGIWRQQ